MITIGRGQAVHDLFGASCGCSILWGGHSLWVRWKCLETRQAFECCTRRRNACDGSDLGETVCVKATL